jgi:hypothetical protein
VLLLLRSFASFRVTLLGRLFSPFLGTFFKWDLIILFMYVYIFFYFCSFLFNCFFFNYEFVCLCIYIYMIFIDGFVFRFLVFIKFVF